MWSGFHVPLTTVIEKKVGIIKISEIIQETLDGQAQHHDDVEPSEKPDRGGSLDEENTQTRVDIQPEAGGPNSQRNTVSEVFKKEQNDVINDFEVQYFKDAHKSENKGKVRPSL